MALNLDRHYESEPLQYESVEKVDKTRMSDTQYREVFRLTALCLGVMCILQATLNIVLRLHFNPEAETDLLNTSYYNLTIDELQIRYANLVKERDQLQTGYNKLVKENKQLQTGYSDLVKERDQLQTGNNDLVKEKDHLIEKWKGLQEMFPKLVDTITLGWKHFNSSLYYISTDKRNWIQSRQECRKSGADLVILNSQEEEDFILEELKNKSAWVGLKGKGMEEWKWVDGTALEARNWTLEQPNDGNPMRQNWMPVPCVNEEWWVCEKPVFQ